VQVAEAEPIAEPDEDEDQQAEQPQAAPEKPGEDPILKKGIEVITKGVPADAAKGPEPAAAPKEESGPTPPMVTPGPEPAPEK